MADAATKRLQHEIARAKLQLEYMSAARRRQLDAQRKAARPVLGRVGNDTLLVAGIVGALELSNAALPRLFVYWHLKRMLRRNIGEVASVDDATIDAAVARACLGHLTADLAAAAADADCRVHFAAARWLAEYDVFVWLVECNLLGASPPSRDLFTRFRLAFPASSRGRRYDALLERVTMSANSEKNWAISFRRRWLVQFRQLPRANPLTDADLRKRVAALVVSCTVRPRSKGGRPKWPIVGVSALSGAWTRHGKPALR
jgi:hypothetical protein